MISLSTILAQKLQYFIDSGLSVLPKKAAKFWHKPYYYIRKIRGGSRLIKLELR